MYREKDPTTMKFTITFFPFVFMGNKICLSGITILPSNPTRGVSYLERSFAFNPNPLNRSRVHHLSLTSLIHKHPLHYKAIDSSSNYESVIMRLGCSF